MPQRIATQRNRDDNSMENMCDNLLRFLSRALQDFLQRREALYLKYAKSPRSGHAIEQAKSREDIINECDGMVSATIEEWCSRHDRQTFYNEVILATRNQMFDIMQCTNGGDDNDQDDEGDNGNDDDDSALKCVHQPPLRGHHASAHCRAEKPRRQ